MSLFSSKNLVKHNGQKEAAPGLKAGVVAHDSCSLEGQLSIKYFGTMQSLDPPVEDLLKYYDTFSFPVNLFGHNYISGCHVRITKRSKTLFFNLGWRISSLKNVKHHSEIVSFSFSYVVRNFNGDAI